MITSWLPAAPAPAKRAGRKARRAPAAALAIERLEGRELPATGLFLQGTAFVDANANGQLDPAESYLQGATVTLYNQSGTPLATTTTGADGRYLFDASNVSKLTPGVYQIGEQAAGHTNTGVQILSALNPAGQIAPDRAQVTLVDPAQMQVSFHSDNVYNDPALFQVVDVTINGVTQTTSAGQLPITISGPGLAQPVTLLTLCNNLFQDLVAGQNTFSVTPQTTNSTGNTPISVHNEGRIGYLYNHYGISKLNDSAKAAALQLAAWELEYDQTPDLAAGNFRYSGALAAQAQAYISESAGKSEAVTVLNATSILQGGWQSMLAPGSINFGNAPAAATGDLEGCVYLDANGNGRHDNGEAGIAGVTVTLLGTDNQGNGISLTTTTNASGDYSFTNLPAGTYALIETQPAGYVDGQDSAGNLGGTVCNDVIHGITLNAGASGRDYCFGEKDDGQACVSGFVYVDANDNGKKEAGEAGIGGVTVTLTGTTSTGQSVTVTTTTDANGFYQFDGLKAGTYTLTEKQPTGFTDGKDTLGSAGGKLGNDKLSNIKLTNGACATDYNFGEKGGNLVTTGQTATIGFWHNKNGQALINSFNGGSTSKALSTWLSQTFPKLYGSQAGPDNLTGFTNAQVATFFQTLFNVKGQKTEAQLLANALAIYATTSSLGGTAAAQYGFTVTAAGVGASLFNVGTSGAAFGVANNTMMTVFDIVKAANNASGGGTLYGGNQTLINQANTVFDGINQKGDII